MRDIRVGDEVIITDVRNILGNNDKTSDSIEEYMAKVVGITQGIGGDTWYTCKLAVINKTLEFPQWEVFSVDGATKNTDIENNINIHDTVWVDMSNWAA